MGSLRMETLGRSGWTQLWSRIGQQGTQWGTALVTLPHDARAVRFVGATGDSFRSDMAVDGFASGLPTVEFDQLTCEFSFDTCLWQSSGASSWQLAGDANGRWLEASGNSSQASERILVTVARFNTSEERVLVVFFQLSGSDTPRHWRYNTKFPLAAGSLCCLSRVTTAVVGIPRSSPSLLLPWASASWPMLPRRGEEEDSLS